MARRYRMCVVEGCGRRSQLGQLVCKDHEATEMGVTMSRQIVKLEREVHSLVVAETEVERIEAAKRFQRRVERGDFAALLTGRFRELVQLGAGEGLTNAVGALQLAIVRLLFEERDPTKMAIALSRVANATANVTRTQEQLGRKRAQEEVELEAMRRSFKTYQAQRLADMEAKEAAVREEAAEVEVATAELKRREVLAWDTKPRRRE